MARSALTSDGETRFSQLVKPIRDLTENWNINIAAFLEEYLMEIENMSISFHGGKTTMNFAEAAMLIQGSAYVYSKKVEFLYHLVMQMLEFLQTNRKLVKKSEADETKTSYAVRDDNDFLRLDDIEIGRNLDLREDSSRLSSIKFLPKIPACLLLLKEKNPDDDEIYTKNGELIGKKTDFRMNTSIFDSSGMLLLAGYHENLYPDLVKELEDDSKTWEISESSSEVEEICDDSSDSDTMNTDFVDLVDDDSPVFLKDTLETHGLSSPRKSTKEEKKNSCDDVLEKNTLKDLDPYMPNSESDMPFNKGIIYSKALELSPSRERVPVRSSPRIKAKLEAIAKRCNGCISNSDEVCKKQSNLPTVNGVKTPNEKQQKQKMKTRKRQKVMLVSEKKSQQVPDENGENNDTDENTDIPDDSFSNDCETDSCSNELQNESQSVDGSRSIRDSLDDEIDDSNSNDDDDDDDEPLARTSYEGLVQAYMDNYLSSAKHFQECNELTKKVNEWSQRITPVLEIAKKRPSFDIHVYGTKVLERFSNNNRKQTLKFSEIVEGKESWEIARYFASSLELANGYNVQISSEGKSTTGNDMIEITLLSHKRHHEELQDYHAPSSGKQRR